MTRGTPCGFTEDYIRAFLWRNLVRVHTRLPSFINELPLVIVDVMRTDSPHLRSIK